MTVQPLFDTHERSSDANATERREEESVLLRTQFLRRIAHDIASPAGVTMTVLEELANDSARPELVAMARRGLRRLLRLSEQLALVADLEAGALVPETAVEDLRAVVKQSLDQAVAIDGRRDVVSSCDVPGDKLAVEIDQRLVGSVLRELVGNALRLASSRVSVEVARLEDHATVRISDDGPGFTPDAVAMLGERFTARSLTRGLGLSLSIAKEVLGAHGGDLHIGQSALPPGRRGVPGGAVVVRLPLV